MTLPRPGALSELGGRFAAGILRHARALSALTAPSPVSAARLQPHRWSAGAVVPGSAQPRGAAAHPAAGIARRRRAGSAAAPGVSRRRRGREPLPRPRRDPARGPRGRARSELPAPAILDATLPSSTQRTPSASASARCRRRSATRSRRSPRMQTARALDDAAPLRRVHRASSAPRSTRRRGAGPRRDCAGAMPLSTEELLARLLGGARARAARRGRAAPPAARRAGARPRRAARRRCPRGRAAGGERAVAGTGRIARIGAARRRPWRCARSSTACRCASARARPSARSGDAMHACGHDVHMAALVALARAARALGEELPAPLLALFQPSEEAYPSGAEQLARGELADARARGGRGCARPSASSPGAPWRWTRALSTPPATRSRSPSRGEPTHGAYPHLGRDPILAIAQIVLALHARWAGSIDPLGPGRRSRSGVLEGGSAENVIPARARARAALRAHRPERSRRAARDWSTRSPAGSRRRTAAARASSSCPASRRSRTTRASSRGRASCSPSARLRARGRVALVRLR